jgi:hypothetical protein
MVDETMTPFRVRAIMGEPVIYSHDGMHLDGVLAWGAYIAHVREHGHDSLPSINAPWALDFDLPLAKWTRPVPDGAQVAPRLLNDNGMLWGWCASAAVADWVTHGKIEVRKRPDIQRMMRYATSPSLHLGAGPHKAFDVPYPTSFAFTIEWYARGDRASCAEMLADVTHVGKKHKLGFGKVLRWDVEDMDDDWSVAKDGVLTRRMPRDDGRMAPIRAPYHHISRLAPCAEVGSAAT